LKQLKAEQNRLDAHKKRRLKQSNLRVIEGGRTKEDSSPDDKTWLN
jgi:hypothetical protein